MKPRLPKQRNQAWNLIEVFFIILVLSFLAVAFLRPVYYANHWQVQHNKCINNLRQICHAYEFWENYDSKQIVTLTLVTNKQGGIWIDFTAMSNVVKDPTAFHCPADTNTEGKISYFVNLDINERNPQMVIFGDDNLAISNKPVNSGILVVSSNTPLEYTRARHDADGSLALGDGSVNSAGDMSGLQWRFTTDCGFATNYLAIP